MSSKRCQYSSGERPGVPPCIRYNNFCLFPETSVNSSDSSVRFSAVRYLVSKNQQDVPRRYFDWGPPSPITSNITHTIPKALSKPKKLKKVPKLKKVKKPKKRKHGKKKSKNLFLADDKSQVPKSKKDKKHSKHKKFKHKKNLKSHNPMRLDTKVPKVNKVQSSLASNEDDIVKILPNLKSLDFQKQPSIRSPQGSRWILGRKSSFYSICGNTFCDHSCLDPDESKCGCYRGFKLANNNITCLGKKITHFRATIPFPSSKSVRPRT